MKIFLDTSSLFKLYHKEEHSNKIEEIFSKVKITNVYLSEITKVEFASSIWKKVRTKEISKEDALITMELFEIDSSKFTFVAIDSVVIEQAKNLISKYGIRGLRTLDAIQLSCSKILSKEVALFITSDNLLQTFLNEEGLPTELKA